MIVKAGGPIRAGAMLKPQEVFRDYKAPCPIWGEIVFVEAKPELDENTIFGIVQESIPDNKIILMNTPHRTWLGFFGELHKKRYMA